MNLNAVKERERTRLTKLVQKSRIFFSIFSLQCRIPRAVHIAVSLSLACVMCVPAICASTQNF